MAQYTMQEMNDLHNEGETLLYPRMVITDCCEGDTLAERMAEGTTFSAGEIQGMFHLLARELSHQMAQGRSVKIEGVGLFTPSLSLKKGKKREAPDGNGTRRNAESIEVGGVNFRPDKELLYELNRFCKLERMPGKFGRRVSKYSPEQRMELAKHFLASHPVLTVSDYVKLTGLSKTTAGRELRNWHQLPDSEICAMGRGAHRVYVLKKGE